MKNKFYKAFWYIAEHRKMTLKGLQYPMSYCLDVDVQMVNPKTNSIDDNKKLNTKLEIWLEFGFPCYSKELKQAMASHDVRLNCGAETFEEAIIKLAKLVKKCYV